MKHAFIPTPDTTRELRTAFGQFTTGVTIVTVASEDGPIGITANSFASVSLDPPLLMWCPDKTSRRFAYFQAAKHFSVHILRQDQADLAMAVAKSAMALSELSLGHNDHGTPVLDQALARFDCETHALHDAGDHVIAVGHILNVIQGEPTAPLAFFNGKAGCFTDAS